VTVACVRKYSTKTPNTQQRRGHQVVCSPCSAGSGRVTPLGAHPLGTPFCFVDIERD
jgi:hypothetical protein